MSRLGPIWMLTDRPSKSHRIVSPLPFQRVKDPATALTVSDSVVTPRWQVFATRRAHSFGLAAKKKPAAASGGGGNGWLVKAAKGGGRPSGGGGGKAKGPANPFALLGDD